MSIIELKRIRTVQRDVRCVLDHVLDPGDDGAADRRNTEFELSILSPKGSRPFRTVATMRLCAYHLAALESELNDAIRRMYRR